MPELAYGEVCLMNPVEARRHLIQTYEKTGSYSETARLWHTSRHVVRKWVRRYRQLGEAGLQDRSRRPHHNPRQTGPEVEQQVMEAWEKTRYGRYRLAFYLRRQGLPLSPHTIRHILRRHRPPQKRVRRKPLYPAYWAWEVELPFSLLQTDVKDVLDKGALGTQRTDHMRRKRLPRYQWTACDGRTRLRFLAYSHRIHRTNGLAFLILVLMWLRAFRRQTPVTFQTDWGQESGGDNPDQVQQLSPQFLQPLGGQLKRYPKGRKGYNGRVERSHRTDDEEFYRPYLLNIRDAKDFLAFSQRWIYFYNALRPHSGDGMNGRTPLAVLHSLGYTGQWAIVAFPPLLLDQISTHLLMACDPQDGNDLLAHYSVRYFPRLLQSRVRSTTITSSSTPSRGVLTDRGPQTTPRKTKTLPVKGLCSSPAPFPARFLLNLVSLCCRESGRSKPPVLRGSRLRGRGDRVPTMQLDTLVFPEYNSLQKTALD